MKEKGPGDLGAGGIESVLGRTGILGGVMVPFSLEPLKDDPSAPDSLNVSRICINKDMVSHNCTSVLLADHGKHDWETLGEAVFASTMLPFLMILGKEGISCSRSCC